MTFLLVKVKLSVWLRICQPKRNELAYDDGTLWLYRV